MSSGIFYDLVLGDCLEVMGAMEPESVDAVIMDVPYGTTSCKFDSIINLDKMWDGIKRIVKKDSAIVMNSTQPFTTTLIGSNMEMFRYCWVWDKTRATNFMSAKLMPLLKTEDVCVFSFATSNSMSKVKMKYNPQGVTDVDWDRKNGSNVGGKVAQDRRAVFKGNYKQRRTGYPKNIIDIPNDNNDLHPTQKPVALLEYLIRTYTDPGDLVFGGTMGSGTTGVACLRTGRKFIGVELDPEYFAIAKKRMGEEEERLNSDSP